MAYVPKRGFTKNLGFTLVEVLVTIAIIGAIAAISSSLGSKTGGKGKQSQAKAMLAGIYSSEKVFFSEYNVYTPYLIDIGFYAEGDLYYNIGFTPTAAGAWTSSVGPTSADGYDVELRNDATGVPNLATQLKTFCTAPRCRYSQVVSGALNDIELGCSTCAATNTAFKVGANSYISNPTVEDRWSMDEDKTLTNFQNGSF